MRDGKEHGRDGTVDEEAVEAVQHLPGGRLRPAPDVGGQHEDVGDGEHVAAVEEEDDLWRHSIHFLNHHKNHHE